MGAELMVPLAIAQAGVGVVSAFAQHQTAQSAKVSQEEALARQTVESYAEIGRQQEEVSRIATEQWSDRIRAANMELGAARVAASERGVSGSTMSAMARHIGYLEGADLSRISHNRVSNLAAGEAAKRSARNGYIEGVNIANNQASAASTGAFLGAVGSGLSIAGNYYGTKMQLDAMQNTR